MVGVVVSDKMTKTRVVQVLRLIKHSLYPRTIRAFTKLTVHDPEEQAKLGDLVRVMETRPISKTKRWRLVEILRRGSAVDALSGQSGESA